jgi:hypothetical protein
MSETPQQIYYNDTQSYAGRSASGQTDPHIPLLVYL